MSLMAGTRHIIEYNALVYRRIWRGSIAVSFFTPLFFLAAMGVGLGGLVNRASGGVKGVPYLDFLAPGLIAAACMQTAAIEGMYPILAKIMWDKTYEAALATPITIPDLMRGEVAWITIRMFIVATMFWIVMYAFGLGSLVPAVATGGGHTVSYAMFVAPALMATSAMNGAVYESTSNFFFKLRYAKTFEAVIQTPVGVEDAAMGEVLWAVMRGCL